MPTPTSHGHMRDFDVEPGRARDHSLVLEGCASSRSAVHRWRSLNSRYLALLMALVAPGAIRAQASGDGDPRYQWVYLRRMNSVLFAAAMNVAITYSNAERTDARMIVYYADDSTLRVSRRRWFGEQPLVMIDTILPSRPGYVAFHFGAEGAPTTFTGGGPPSVLPPPSLSDASMPALSTPVLLRPFKDHAPMPLDPVMALEQMTPYRTVPRGSEIGVYWETYGIPPGDSVDVALTVTAPSKRNSLIAHRWTDAAPGTGSLAIPDSGVPIVSRSVLVNTSHLASGTYTIEITVAPRGGAAVQSAATIIVR